MHHITVSGREKISSCESFVKPLSRRGVILDVDGTLSPEVSWTALTRRLGGSVAEHSRIFDQYRHGEISYVESRIQLIGLWQSSGNASRQNFLDIFESFTLRPGAISLVVELEAAGFELCIITGSFDLYAQSVATKLGVRNFYANTPLYFQMEKSKATITR
ncbi:MAG TPA: HAD-IB family phosphatase [Candidatus Saccharimonadia bacterium]|nr:HAD-IB family phosphatase [Candidatus Saccharimonadia bacterium]